MTDSGSFTCFKEKEFCDGKQQCNDGTDEKYCAVSSLENRVCLIPVMFISNTESLA